MKNLSMAARFSVGIVSGDNRNYQQYITEMEDVNEVFENTDLGKREARMFFDGVLFASTEKPTTVMEQIRMLRRSGMLPYDFSISRDYSTN